MVGRKLWALLFALILLALSPLQAFASSGVQLVLQPGAHGKWSRLDNDRMKAHFTVANTSDKTVKSFEMRVYATDDRGMRIYGESTYFYWTTKKEIAPGETASSDECTLPDCSRIARLYAAVKKVAYTDGTQQETDDGALNYVDWRVDWDH